MNIPILSDATRYSRLAFDLRDFLRKTITLEQSKQVISQRLQNREENFLRLVQKGIYGNSNSPYLKLLGIAGCEFGDIEAMAKRDGVDATLHKLLAAGIYISWEEFKGKKDVIRSGNHVRFRETDFDNPFLESYYRVRSSASRSAGTRTQFDLRHRSDISYYYILALAVRNALNTPMGIWMPVLPSLTGISGLLHYWNIGNPVARWFTPVDENQVRASLRDRVALRFIIYAGRFWGAKLVKPEYVTLEQSAKVAQWITDTKKRYGGCSLTCFPSLMVKVCQSATENGLDISGTNFFGGGEPLTEAKRRQIEAAGAIANPRYWITEIGFIGCGCPAASAVDDIHLFSDSVAVIQNQRKIEHTDMSVNAFFFTSLLTSAPKIMLNVESDDYGVMETRNCGCLLGELGLDRHLYNIRSFAKLTGSGMTIIGSDFVRILEEVLPQKYGGASTDYQLLEEEDDQGQTHLNLIISPDVRVIDEKGVIDTVLEELRRSAYGGKLASGFWSQVNTLRIRRMHPISASGKVQTLHLVSKQ
jgi:hypothetical protein